MIYPVAVKGDIISFVLSGPQTRDIIALILLEKCQNFSQGIRSSDFT
jgi:hypothetical protein